MAADWCLQIFTESINEDIPAWMKTLLKKHVWYKYLQTSKDFLNLHVHVKTFQTIFSCGTYLINLDPRSKILVFGKENIYCHLLEENIRYISGHSMTSWTPLQTSRSWMGQNVGYLDIFQEIVLFQYLFLTFYLGLNFNPRNLILSVCVYMWLGNIKYIQIYCQDVIFSIGNGKIFRFSLYANLWISRLLNPATLVCFFVVSSEWVV